MKNVVLVTYPRFGEPALGLFFDELGVTGGGWQLTNYVEGDWLEHVEWISQFPRLPWNEIGSFNQHDPCHKEIANELLLAGGMLATSLGTRFTTETRPDLHPEIVLNQLDLDFSRIELYEKQNGFPTALLARDPAGAPLFSAEHEFEWQVLDVRPGEWIDEVLAEYEQLERAQSQRRAVPASNSAEAVMPALGYSVQSVQKVLKGIRGVWDKVREKPGNR
jgi:hypothetical protein